MNRVKTPVKTKKCRKCQRVQPASEFYKNKRSRDGLLGQCRECCRVAQENRKSPTGIDTWDQVGDAIREIAELEAAIDNENALCEKRVAMVREYSAEATNSWEEKIMALRALIKGFIQAKIDKGFKRYREYLFGSILIRDGNFKLKLNKELAAKMKGKP